MKRTLALAGLLLCSLSAGEAHAKPLYETIKENVEREIYTDKPDEEVVKYLHAIFDEKWDITQEDVEKILKGEGLSVCGSKQSGEAGKSFTGCDVMTQEIIRLAGQEGRVRALGRGLQALATGYELPLSEIPGHPIKFSTDLRGIVNIWSTEGTLSGEGVSSPSSSSSSSSESDSPPVFLPDNPIYPRTQPIVLLDDEGEYNDKISAIASALDALSKEEQIAAVWRYMYGVRLVDEKRAPDYPPPYEDGESGEGTERQYLFKRWEELEKAMMSLWNWDEKFPKDPAAYNPPLKKNDVVYFLIKEPLNEEVILWLRVDGDPAGNHPMGDIGLHFKMPLEPLLPSLIHRNEAILGGTYPPEPMTEEDEREEVNGRRICSMPAAQRGYLCRPFLAALPENRCPEEFSDEQGNPLDPTAIRLTTCEIGEEQLTIAGPDVCREIPWKEPDGDSMPCKVAMRCSAQCGDEEDHLGYTTPKNSEGVIEVCIENDPEIPMTYVLYHELMHAYQFCGMPPMNSPYSELNAEEANAFCCRTEGEAYQAHCKMMEEDGIIGPATVINGIPITTEACAEFFTDKACRGTIEIEDGEEVQLQGCPASRAYPASLWDELKQKVAENPADVPASCNEAIGNPDLRVQTLLETIEKRDPVCTVMNLSEYKNRIGNELCFIGQCMEESLELHRLVPGRNPATVGDQAFPWDNPLTGLPPLGNLITNSPAGPGFLPQYRPQLLAAEFETALCQLQGLPARTPPILCAIDSSRRLDLPLKNFFPTAFGLIGNAQEGETAETDLLSLATGIGTRMGTHLYTTYLRTASRSFAETLTSAKDLLTDIKEIEFPSQMCPIGNSPLLSP